MSSRAATITSTSNPRVRDALDLRDRRHREEAGRFLIEGLVELDRAVDAGVVVELVFRDVEAESPRLTDIVERARNSGTEVVAVSPGVAARICVRKGPALAVARCFSLDLGSFDPPTPELILAVERIEKPGNLGGMLRTAAAVGAAVLACDVVTDVFNPSVVRASLGTLFSVPVAQALPVEARRWLDRRSIRFLAATPGAETPIWDVDLTGPVAIAIGAEDRGLSEDLTTGASHASIPMSGGADSLNASVAAAVVLYEGARQRRAGA